MTQEHSVLIVSDQPERARGLARAIGKVIACRHVSADGPMPPVRPLVAMVDLQPGNTAVTTWTMRLAAARLPALLIAGEAPPGLDPGVVRLLPPTVPRGAILAALFDIIDVALKAPVRCDGPESVIETKAHRACGIVADVFDAAQSGRALCVAEVDAGTEVILEAISDGGIRTWLETIGRYDEQLYQHSLSVAGYAAAFGFTLKLARADQMRLAKAALLHDIGKSKISRDILNKPGKLTADEMAVMRTHPAIGADILARHDGFDAAMLSVVRHHHEMLDGTGYPDRLSGDAVPDLVRLVTICDIHSALTERRAYRDPLPHDEAHAIMLTMSGKLDGDLLRAFQPIIRQTSAAATAG